MSADDVLDIGDELADIVEEVAQGIHDPMSRKGNGQATVVKHPSATPAADLAERYLAARNIRLVYWRANIFRYTGTHYVPVPECDLKADIIRFLQGTDSRRVTGNRLAAEVICNLQALSLVPADAEPPVMLTDDGPLRVQADLIPLSNGILSVSAYLRRDPQPLLQHGQEWFFLHSLPYSFEYSGECKLWQRVLAENLPDPEHQKLLQEWYGLNLVHDTTYERFLVMYGEAGTGKTVACAVHRALLGESAVSSVPLEAFSPFRTFPLAATVGKLANIAEEVGEIDKAAEGLLKQYVSGSVIAAEKKHQDVFNFKPTARLTFATNVLPRFSDRSNGVWRRMLILPFDQVVPLEKKDRRLLESRYWEQSGELPGILLWALEGLRRLREQCDFSEPVDCRVIREQYKRDANPAAVFLHDNCETEPTASTSAPALYKAYSDWVKDLGHHALSEPIFAREVRRAFPLVEKGNNPVRMPDRTRTRLWYGLRYIGVK